MKLQMGLLFIVQLHENLKIFSIYKKMDKPKEIPKFNKKLFENFNLYLGIFIVLLYVFLILLTYVMYVNRKIYNFTTSTAIWCFDDWKCDSITPYPEFPENTYVNPCFSNPNYTQTGLSQCLYGYGSTLTSQCYNQVCTCPSTLTGGNCLAGCVYGKTNKNAEYCCFTGANSEQCPPPQ